MGGREGQRTGGLEGQKAATSQHARRALAYHPQRVKALSAPAIQGESRLVPPHFSLHIPPPPGALLTPSDPFKTNCFQNQLSRLAEARWWTAHDRMAQEERGLGPGGVTSWSPSGRWSGLMINPKPQTRRGRHLESVKQMALDVGRVADDAAELPPHPLQRPVPVSRHHLAPPQSAFQTVS